MCGVECVLRETGYLVSGCREREKERGKEVGRNIYSVHGAPVLSVR